jgi:hypothetical protein
MSQTDKVFNELYNEGIKSGIDGRTASIHALCKLYSLKAETLKKTVELAMEKAKIYGSKKSKATVAFVITNDQTAYDKNMVMIDEKYNLLASEWFILKKFNETIQYISFIK